MNCARDFKARRSVSLATTFGIAAIILVAASRPVLAETLTSTTTRTATVASPSPIDVNVTRASVRDVLHFLAAHGDVDLILADGIAGRVTVNLKGVDWWSAFETIARSKGLGIQRDGRVVLVDRLERLTAYDVARVDTANAQAANAMRVTRVIRLSYARADDLAPIVRDLLTPEGTVVVDRRTNTLIVTDVASRVGPLVQRLSR